MISVLGFCFALALGAGQVRNPRPTTAETELVRLGAIIHTSPGTREVIEVRLNERPLKNDDLRWQYLVPLRKLEQLHVGRTGISDQGLKTIPR